MSKRVILLIASLAVIVGLMVSSSSYAWFTTQTAVSQSINVSVVSSVHSANLTDIETPEHTIIVQGDNLVSLDGKPAMLQLDNKSTADTQVRVSIEYTSYRTGSAQQVIYSANENDDVDVVFASGKWAKNINSAGICYFYYMGDGYSGSEISNVNDVPAVSPEVATIPVISSVAYKSTISPAYSGQPINVKITFESKQADNITWSTIDSYDVSGVNE